MACTPAPAAKALLAEATAQWPKRSRASDGICPSLSHTAASPKSDHELGNAGDLTHDPANGCDAHAEARRLVTRRDRRVKYIISNRQIWNPLIATRATYSALRTEGVGRLRALASAAPGWRSYTGPNPHTTHAHVSIHAAGRNDTRPWFVDVPGPPVPPPAPSWKWEDYVPNPTDFTSACMDPVTGGWWQQTARGGVDGHNGAVVHDSYLDHPELGGGIRLMVAIVPSMRHPGSFIQIASDGSVYDWPTK